MSNERPGTRLRCETCGAEFVVIKKGDGQTTCCGTEVKAR
jgi:hypothetical protein